jgi:hypothetical protein
MFSINDILSITTVNPETGELVEVSEFSSYEISKMEWHASLSKAIEDGFLMRIPCPRSSGRYFLNGQFAVIDGDVHRILSVGSEKDSMVFVNAASTKDFVRQKNGLNPLQICDWIPKADLQRSVEFPEATSPAHATRLAFNAVPNRRLASDYAVSTVYSGVAGDFLVSQHQASDKRCLPPVLHVARLLARKPLSDMDETLMVQHYKISGSNELVTDGGLSIANEYFVDKWREAGLPVPKVYSRALTAKAS